MNREKIARELVQVAKELQALGPNDAPLTLTREADSLSFAAQEIEDVAAKVYDTLVDRRTRNRMDRKQVDSWLKGIASKMRAIEATAKTVAGLANELRGNLDDYDFQS